MKKGTILGVIVIVVLVVILGILIYLIATDSNNKNTNSNSMQNIGQMQKPEDNMPNGGFGVNSGNSVDTTGATEVTDSQTLNGKYETSDSDTAVIRVTSGGNATIEGATVNKSGGDASDTETSDFYGGNAGILTEANSTSTIKNTTITTNAKGGNAVFATGENAKVYISDSQITTTGSSSSRGLDATYGGYIEANNVTISTQGGSCASLATDRGEGTVIAKNSNLSTNGSGSPIIYSTGDISIENTQGTATGAQMVVVEGKNTATVNNSTLIASGKGNRNDVDNSGIMIYQSMSGDAGEGTGTFNSTNSTLEIDSNSSYYNTAPFFFVTNTTAIINLENNTLKYGSNVLINAKGTSEWGNSGNNGGVVTLNTINQKLTGNIIADNISTVTINLTENSSLEGAINSENTAKSITLKIDKSSSLTLTGDTYVNSLEDADSSYGNINFNGYKLYVNNTAIN